MPLCDDRVVVLLVRLLHDGAHSCAAFSGHTPLLCIHVHSNSRFTIVS